MILLKVYMRHILTLHHSHSQTHNYQLIVIAHTFHVTNIEEVVCISEEIHEVGNIGTRVGDQYVCRSVIQDHSLLKVVVTVIDTVVEVLDKTSDVKHILIIARLLAETAEVVVGDVEVGDGMHKPTITLTDVI